MVDRSLLLVPSGIAHGPILPMITRMVIPFIKHYFTPSAGTLDAVISTMGGNGDDDWREFFDIMMSSYKIEMKPPKEYKARELESFSAPLQIIASSKDIFFPADRVFDKAGKIFKGHVTTAYIDTLHLPSEDAMIDICRQTAEFLRV